MCIIAHNSLVNISNLSLKLFLGPLIDQHCKRSSEDLPSEANIENNYLLYNFGHMKNRDEFHNEHLGMFETTLPHLKKINYCRCLEAFHHWVPHVPPGTQKYM